jgi:hypothetical protein
MLDQLLDLFPGNTHPLVLVSDPDGLLADEIVLSALSKRGFQIIQENDPILLRYRVEQIKRFDSSNPVLIITDGALKDLPYDLWQQGQYVELALHEFFPNLSYPILCTLSALQLASLGQIEQPVERVGERRTVQFLLEHLFKFTSNVIQQPAYFVLWLDEFHQSLAPLPLPILESVLDQLNQSGKYQGWNTKELLQDSDAYRQFVQDQWQGFLSIQTGKALKENSSPYLLHFESNQGLQDALPRLLRSGSLTPVQLETKTPMPVWMLPGVLTLDEDPRPRQMNELVASLTEALTSLTSDSRWEEWQAIGYQGAELTTLYNDSYVSVFEQQDSYKKIQKQLDDTFTKWLIQKYSSLATKRLPIPHHVHHIPHYLNYLRSQGSIRKVALLVMDGMSLADWLLLKRAWQSRQPDWQMKENLVLAQIPTITAISRQSLISGLFPSDFFMSYTPKMTEAKAWNAFWANKELPENTIQLIALKLEKDDPTPEITNPRLQALCLIERQLDEIMHGSVLGGMDHQSTVKLWLSQNNPRNSANLESLMNLLFDQGFTVFLTSDHGHCEAYGMGQPSEGIIARSRGKRARLYSDRRLAEQTQIAFPDTIIWEDDGLLPKNLVALLPSGRLAFTEHEAIVITHGGITMDEIVVPLVEIKKR